MFVAGALVGGVVVGAIAHDDHSNYGDHYNYSEYGDASLREEIRRNEASLEEHERLAKRLEEEFQENLTEEIENLQADNHLKDCSPNKLSVTTLDELKDLSNESLRVLQNQIDAEIAKDEEHIQEIDRAIQRINALTLLTPQKGRKNE
ncbi:MAG: hypothetical protein PUH38_06800 [Acidaminococcus fermentans]|uniref:hypothetical protein n=1 Tax=Acidaminococcus TaxID=904 RepID=UPI002430B581|nr:MULTISPECIES: hypothetical protein [Acidaminococcus]MDD7196157.1 hypothetical protein [Acidaminococcus fermentans]